MFWSLVKMVDQVFRAVLDTGATLSIVAPRLLTTFEKTKTFAIREGVVRTIHSLGGGRCDYMHGRQNCDPALLSAGNRRL